MKPITHDLFLLMGHLFQLNSPKTVKSLFIEAANQLQDDFSIEKAKTDTHQEKIEICTAKCNYGHFYANHPPNQIDPEFSKIFYNAVQMLAVILEKLSLEQNLNWKARDSEQKFRNIFENAGDGILYINKEAEILDANSAFTEITSVPKQEVIGISVYQLAEKIIDEQNLPSIKEIIKRSLKKQNPIPFEVKFKNKILEVNPRQRSEDGNIIGIVRDITEQKRTNQALKKRDKILEAVAKSAENFSRGADFSKNVHKMLRELGESTGVSRVYIFENFKDESGNILTSQRFEWIDQGITSQIDNQGLQNFEMSEAGFDRWVKKLSNQEVVHGNITDFPKSEHDALKGQNIISITIVPIFVMDNWWGFIGFDECRFERKWSDAEIDALRAVAGTLGGAIERHNTKNALRQSEKKYREIFNNANDAIFLHTMADKPGHGSLLEVNEVACEILNYKKDELKKKQVIDLFPPQENATIKKIREKLQNRGTATAELTFQTKDDDYVPVEVSSHMFSLNYNETVLSIVRDISERKRTQKEKEKLQEQLFQSQKMESIGTLAEGVAHDFNNILSVILGLSQLVISNIDESNPNYSSMESILNSAERAAELTRQLMLFSRKQEMDFQTVNVNELISRLRNMLNRIIGENIEIHNEFDRNIWEVKADKSQIEQVITNLVLNAREAMPHGGALSIRTENVKLDKNKSRSIPSIEPGRYVRIEVEDKGIGIDDDIIQKIFDPFFTTKKRSERNGMGLAVAHGIIKKHNGFIDVESEPGQGSIFKVYLPVIGKEKLKAQKEKENLFEYQSQGETVLVVEDELSFLKFLKNILDSQGYDYYSARNSEQALDIFSEHGSEIDLLLSDVVMSGIDGIDLAGILKNQNQDLKVILTSGYSDNRVNSSTIREKGYKFIRKPYGIKKLMEIVRNTLDEND